MSRAWLRSHLLWDSCDSFTSTKLSINAWFTSGSEFKALSSLGWNIIGAWSWRWLIIILESSILTTGPAWTFVILGGVVRHGWIVLARGGHVVQSIVVDEVGTYWLKEKTNVF